MSDYDPQRNVMFLGPLAISFRKLYLRSLLLQLLLVTYYDLIRDPFDAFKELGINSVRLQELGTVIPQVLGVLNSQPAHKEHFTVPPSILVKRNSEEAPNCDFVGLRTRTSAFSQMVYPEQELSPQKLSYRHSTMKAGYHQYTRDQEFLASPSSPHDDKLITPTQTSKSRRPSLLFCLRFVTTLSAMTQGSSFKCLILVLSMMSTGLAYTGEATFYEPGGSCGTAQPTNYDFLVALSPSQFSGEECGKLITVTYEGKSVNVTVIDECAGCGGYDIDLTPDAFEALAPLSGRLLVNWNYV
ncbi:hypothetical protein SERLA73DRAFT_77873 [Serpula lacrymans var. lacrymans S7.3]|uniref:Uncharacterized protein n=2 Tax=Serpula lacrymans var. lacrymans TaxID=341189 RepID=F8QB99_SERL3|nr:uncharacterized protein SERLADRAFT_442777 [Serpula lacrymans var. lacrymans S7.9]EGN94485.1 hypothetical protein SERLA73DRAFT_77873 [Serpula lacrymans var. lacrymans S7.3]EGO19964.1 hypothetical protein SERLADRAFT_442777 [Serpula lacrymans var. lacrymans S7.9]